MAEIDRWALERACWAGGIALVCGCDEAGAGPLAGAVYAGAVILPPECSIEGLNDSKQVTPKRRDAPVRHDPNRGGGLGGGPGRGRGD